MNRFPASLLSRSSLPGPGTRRSAWALAVAGLFAAPFHQASADTINVGAGGCTLIDAITAANTDNPTGSCPGGNGADTLVLAAGSTHTLTAINNTPYGPTGLPAVNSSITIQGNGGAIVRDSAAPSFRIFAVVTPGELVLQHTRISQGRLNVGNQNRDDGAGIAVYEANLSLTDCTVSGNTTTSSGGGIYARGSSVSITNSTLSGNKAQRGGGMFSYAELGGQQASETSILNSTISGNSATSVGGGLFNVEGLLTINFSTITANTAPIDAGAGVLGVSDDRTQTEVHHSIIAGNSPSDVDVTGTINSFLSNGYNLIGDGNAVANFSNTGDSTGVANPDLRPLGNNGGPTRTHSLRDTSPALNAAGSCGGTDQRGVSRPRRGDCDIGAFELAEPDTTPDPFDFVDKLGIQGKTNITSNTVKVGGLGSGVSAPISISDDIGGDATYSINGGSFRQGPSTVKNGDKVRLRNRIPTNSGTASAVLHIGTVSDSWTITTDD